MKKKILILFLFANISLVSGQTPDFAASYILREIHILMAQEYKNSVTTNQPNYLTYIANIVATFVAPRSPIPLISPTATNQIVHIQANRVSCLIFLNPKKIIRCQDRLDLLTAAATASDAILLAPSVYPINNALRIKLEMEALAIQNLINEYLYK